METMFRTFLDEIRMGNLTELIHRLRKWSEVLI